MRALVDHHQRGLRCADVDTDEHRAVSQLCSRNRARRGRFTGKTARRMFGLGKKKADDPNQLTQPIPPGWKMVDLGLLGSGGMSRVYRVRDESLGREVAFKVLRPELLEGRRGARPLRRRGEASPRSSTTRTSRRSTRSPSDKKRSTCFTMKVLEGRSLQEMLLDPSRREAIDGLFPALEVLVRVCDAVAFAHSRGICHCDLKPQNVMVAEHGQIYVVDWGLARRKANLPAEGDDDDGAIGTPAYMAPEQARGQNHAHRRAHRHLRARRHAVPHPRRAAAVRGEDRRRARSTLATEGDRQPPDAGRAEVGTQLPRRLVAIA